MKIAIYSGSFNPVHNGHLAVAKAALNEGSDEVWLLVSPQNPHKTTEELWPFGDRLKMVELAIANQPKMRANDCENNLPRPSYTINTLEYLQQTYPHHQFRLLIGGDNLLKFHLWKDYRRILDLFGLIVYPRSTTSSHEYDNHPNVTHIQAPLLDISSSEIRKRVSAHLTIQGLVSSEVEKYILQELKTDHFKSDF